MEDETTLNLSSRLASISIFLLSVISRKLSTGDIVKPSTSKTDCLSYRRSVSMYCSITRASLSNSNSAGIKLTHSLDTAASQITISSRDSQSIHLLTIFVLKHF